MEIFVELAPVVRRGSDWEFKFFGRETRSRMGCKKRGESRDARF
jgi:hypothetical protein